jgi:hypothetical protein
MTKESALGSHWLERYVGPGADVGSLKKHFLPLSGIEQWYLGRPPVVRSLNRLQGWNDRSDEIHNAVNSRALTRDVICQILSSIWTYDFHWSASLTDTLASDRLPVMFVILYEVRATPVLDCQKKMSDSGFKTPLQTSTRYAWWSQAYRRVANVQHPQTVRLQIPMT